MVSSCGCFVFPRFGCMFYAQRRENRILESCHACGFGNCTYRKRLTTKMKVYTQRQALLRYVVIACLCSIAGIISLAIWNFMGIPGRVLCHILSLFYGVPDTISILFSFPPCFHHQGNSRGRSNRGHRYACQILWLHHEHQGVQSAEQRSNHPGGWD